MDEDMAVSVDPAEVISPPRPHSKPKTPAEASSAVIKATISDEEDDDSDDIDAELNKLE